MAIKIEYSNKHPKHVMTYNYKSFANKVTYRKKDFYEGDKVEVTYNGRVIEGFIVEFVPNSHYSKRQLGSVMVAVAMAPGSSMYVHISVQMNQIKFVDFLAGLDALKD